MSTEISHARLDALRRLGDPPADSLVDELAASDERSLRGLEDALAAGTPLPRAAPVRSFLEAAGGWPGTIDASAPEHAQAAFGRDAAHVLRLLGLGSLPDSYCNRSIARTLARSSRLRRDPVRRIHATAQMVTAVLSPGGLAPGGAGIEAVLRTRLRHALIRRSSRSVRAGASAVPINQEDLVATLLTFSWRLLPRFARDGGSWDPPTQDAYLETWNAVGIMLGIRADAIPRNRAETAALERLIEERHYGPSAEGRELVRVLVAAYARPGLPPGFVEDVIRLYVGDRLADMLGV